MHNTDVHIQLLPLPSSQKPALSPPSTPPPLRQCISIAYPTTFYFFICFSVSSIFPLKHTLAQTFPYTTAKMTEDAWLATLILFFIAPTILLSLRIYYDTSRYLRAGYMASSLISLLFAIGSYLFFATACGMTLWRSRRRVMFMDRVDATQGKGQVPPMQALGKPLSEATILHSYIVPTGLWLCKASFVAMCTLPLLLVHKKNSQQERKGGS